MNRRYTPRSNFYQNKYSSNNNTDFFVNVPNHGFIYKSCGSYSHMDSSEISYSQKMYKWRQLGLYFCNIPNGTICGRTPTDFVRILVFYIIFYSGITLFFMLFMAPIMHFWILADYPRLTGKESILRLNPGLAVVPMSDRLTTLIHYRPNYKHSYKKHVDTLAAFTKWYDIDYQVAGDSTYFVDCYKTKLTPTDTRASCRQWLNMGGRCNIAQEYGYNEIMPCVILKLNRIYGWLPDPLDNITGVGVQCQGVYPADKDNIGELCYYDDDTMNKPQGECKSGMGVFHSYYFPYLRQTNYQSPLVFVEFVNPSKFVVIMVECFAIAKNIDVDFQRREGSVRFELFID